MIAGMRLWKALSDFRDVAGHYDADGEALLELEDGLNAMRFYDAKPLEECLLRLDRAISIIESSTPVSSVSERGRPWKPLLDPYWLIYFADLAQPGDQGYLQQLEILHEVERGRELDAQCARPTKAGTPCKSIPIFRPGSGRNVACSRHLSPEERTELEGLWELAEKGHACPGCGAGAGVPCSEDAELTVVEGQWPRIRWFAPRKMHDVRLALVGGQSRYGRRP